MLEPDFAEHIPHPPGIADEPVVKLGQVFQRERPAEAASGDGSDDLLEVEDALRVSEREVLLAPCRPSIRQVEAADTAGVVGDVGQHLRLRLMQVRGVIAGRMS